MSRRGYIMVMLASAALTACGKAEPSMLKAPPAKLAEGFSFIPDFVREADCRPLGQTYIAPPIGARYTYLQHDGPRSDRVISRVDGVTVTVRLQVYRDAAGEHAVPGSMTRNLIAGVLPSPGESSARTIRYAEEPWPVLAALRPGETALIDISEKTSFGAERTISAPIVLKYEGCGSVAGPLGSERVRVYRTSTPGVSYRPASGASVRRGETAIYLSETRGFPVAFQGAQTSVLVAEALTPPPA